MSALARQILDEAEAEEPAAYWYCGFYRCTIQHGRNAQYSIHMLMCDGQWRDTHRRQRGLAPVRCWRKMTEDEKVSAKGSNRLMSFRYEGLLSLMEDELPISGLRFCGQLLINFGDVSDFEDAKRWLRIQYALKNAAK